MEKRIRKLLYVVLLLVLIIVSLEIVAVAAETAPATEHMHDWEIQYSRNDYHYLICFACKETKAEAHTPDSEEFCTICGRYAHIHKWQCTKADAHFHTIVCSSCGESKTVTHSFDDAGFCAECGYTEHEHIWLFNGETYADGHSMKCAQCDATSSEKCTLGSDGKCTVCGQLPAHWHEYHWDGKKYSGEYHVIECDCGATVVEEHKLAWDGVNRTDRTHGMACVVCGATRTHGHWYSYAYQDGEVCIECGYEAVKHTWKYNGVYGNESHELICSNCSKTKYERHKRNNKGNCSVCGCHVHKHDAVVTAPTCTEGGYTTYICTCGDSYVADEVAAVGHDWVEANCKEPKICTVCSTTSGETGDHVYDNGVDGICNVCGVDRVSTKKRQVHHMLRMYNPNTGEHFYTGSEVERDNLIAAGWNYEGVAFTFPANTGAPVHRLFQPSTGEHLYTMDEAEKERLLSEGWNYEGVAFNSAYNTEAVQHRLYNPNATVGAYHFTFSEEEMQNLIDAGWWYQGIGWYSCWK